MKKAILGTALCGAVVALAGAANADDGADFLSGSTHALFEALLSAFSAL